MDKSLIDAVSFKTASMTYSNAWCGHVAFAAWLVRQVEPECIVELGTFSGNSYFAFCQSVKEANLATQCFAVDTWQGDEHGGYYDKAVYEYVVCHNHQHFADFSTLLRMTFDKALEHFPDRSVDLLHIDGLHTYEAVKHDFEAWLPKLRPGAFVLFHDICVHDHGFGVWKLWEEVCASYPRHIAFVHSNGLGVLKLDERPDESGFAWMVPGSTEQTNVLTFFRALGDRDMERFALMEARRISQCEDLGRQILELRQALSMRDEKITTLGHVHDQLNETIDDLNATIDDLLSSESWRITRPLRLMGAIARGLRSTDASKYIHDAKKVFAYVRKGNFRGLIERIEARTHDRLSEQAAISVGDGSWGIMTTPHTLYIASLMSEQLVKLGWHVDILTSVPAHFDHDLYVVICPQMFSKLPPGKKRISFQMEQSVNDRWFTKNYLTTLNTSLAVLDYSLINIENLAARGIRYPLVHYLPIGAIAGYDNAQSAPDKTCDVLFYGDSKSCKRRQQMLVELQKHFSVRVVSEMFGDEMCREIRKARLVVNLHYYENALLETPRIQECLSLGVPVVSETAQDQDDYPELSGAVRFFEQGSISGMIDAVRSALAEPVPAEVVLQAVAKGARRFEFMFARFLIAMGFLPGEHVSTLEMPESIDRDFVVLSLPETIHRRRMFEAHSKLECWLFDGLRRRPGWIGCGLSYQMLSKHFLAKGKEMAIVMEDDVLFPDDFSEKIGIVREYLVCCEVEWDVFAGVIANVHEDTQVLSVEEYKGLTFVTINKMTSTVCNIYSRKALKVLASWDSADLDAETNTIDRFLQSRSDLRVVVTLPFLVGHREDVQSTLWGFLNTQYKDLIVESEQSLFDLVDAWSHSSNGTKRAMVSE